MMKLLVKNIGQLVTVVEGGEVCLAGKGMGQIKVGEEGFADSRKSRC